MNWKPTCRIEQTEKVIKKIDEIAEIIISNKINNTGFMGGKTGLALFLFYYSRFTSDEKYSDYAEDLIIQVFEEINNGFDYPTYAGGLAGIGWILEHLSKESYIELDSDEVLSEIDHFLFKAMNFDIEQKKYDFLHGAIGYGLYFLMRDNDLGRKAVETLVIGLESISEKDNKGKLKWLSEIDKDQALMGYNLGLSHGISSIISFLGKAYNAGIHKEKSLEQLDGAVKFLLSNSADINKSIAIFPNWVNGSSDDIYSRMAWCYGDPGIGAALYNAAKNSDKEIWKNKAIEILKHTTKRKDIEKNGLKDAGICHGTVGLLQIYNRLYNESGEQIFKDSAEYWLEQTFQMARFDDFAGFKVWRSESDGGWNNDAGFLEGLAGIGLVLISTISEIDPLWDKGLLIS